MLVTLINIQYVKFIKYINRKIYKVWSASILNVKVYNMCVHNHL